MSAFTRAFSEIETASDMVLTFWIEDMRDDKSRRGFDQTAQLRDQLTEQGMTVRHLVSVAVGLDQFAVTGSTGPTSFLCDVDTVSFDQIVIDVRSPSDTVASLALRPEEMTSPSHISERRYDNGMWHDVLLTERGRVVKKRPVHLTNPVSVTIIGRAELQENAHAAYANLATSALETQYRVRGLTWHDPLRAWFMPRLNQSQTGGFVLVDAEGRHVAVTGNVTTP